MYIDEEYLEILDGLLDSPNQVNDRTGVGTKVLTNQVIRVNLQEDFPILRSKKVFWKSVVGELLWFLEGSTDNARLAEITYGDRNHRTIWSDNLEAYQKKVSCIESNYLGPIYGHQWRSFNGVDQINVLINDLRNNPFSRRHIVSAWNPISLDIMALPPWIVTGKQYVYD